MVKVGQGQGQGTSTATALKESLHQGCPAEISSLEDWPDTHVKIFAPRFHI